MDPALIEILLWRSESDVLDFKRDQYPFAGADDDAKGELVKDILAFANAWKTEDAYILIGFEDKHGGKAGIVGITEHIDDASLQQLVNSKTNRPVRFSYVPLLVDGKSAAAIRVEVQQERPIYLKRGFGKLKSNVVYVRRGSSTAEANPDEVSSMGGDRSAQGQLVPQLELEFAEPGLKKRLGKSALLTSLLVLPRPSPPRSDLLGVGPALEVRRWGEPTREEVEGFHIARAYFDDIGLVVKNTGSLVALDVKLQMRVDYDESVSIVDRDDLPKDPYRHMWPDPTPYRAPRIQVTHYEDHWDIRASVGKLQPHEEEWIAWLHVGSKREVKVPFLARLSADNLPRPIASSLELVIAATEKPYDSLDYRGRWER